MTCTYPLRGYQILNQNTENGKNLITFKENEINGRPYTTVDLPCGQCMGCRIDKSRAWALRCVQESTLHEDNCFITLTYNDKNVNSFGSLEKQHLQNFMKELRRKYANKTTYNSHTGLTTKNTGIRFFSCGEYGNNFDRPHYHILLFGFDFDDKEYLKTENGYPCYTSEKLSKLWRKGFHLIGECSYESAAYIARYCTKKLTGKKADETYQTTNPYTGEIYPLEPEFIIMSRNPGIGKKWFDKFKGDLYPKDYITLNGKVFRTPKYYDKLFEIEDPQQFEAIKSKRRKEMIKNSHEKTLVRLKCKMKQIESKQQLYERKI